MLRLQQSKAKQTDKDWSNKTAMAEKRLNLIDEENQILLPYHPEDHEDLFQDRVGMPSHRIYETKQGRKALKGLKLIEERYQNRSWYSVIAERAQEYLDKEALFYRGNQITYREMIARGDQVARSLAALGVKKGDMIFCCIANIPEVAYLMLGINKIGAKMNCVGSHFAPVFLDEIISECTDKVLFVSDDEYPKMKEYLEKTNVDQKVIISKADSLPEHPEQCPGYEKTLDRYYHYHNYAADICAVREDSITFPEFMALGESFEGEIADTGRLDDEFLVTYTSGSTKIGFPKQMFHRNRSLITIGVFHDPELCGNPAITGLRSLAHIHTESNTDLITCYSDSFMQHWSVAPEPDYARENFLEYLFVDKPNIVQATTTFCLEAAREYLIDGRFHENGKGRKLDFLLVLMAVGEPCTPGEERFCNEFLKEAKAGSGVKLFGPFHFRHITLGYGGGDTEHGGIYYTLWRSLEQKLHRRALKGGRYGLKPVPYVQATVLKKNEDGSFSECGYNEPGVIVANCSTTLERYSDFSKVKEKIITDDRGIDWVSCDVFGYIDDLGCVHMKDRRDSKVIMENGEAVYPYKIVDVIQKDPENILSSIITTSETDGKTMFIVNLELSPLKKEEGLSVIRRAEKRILKEFPELKGRLVYRSFDASNPFPIGGSGKRNAVAVEKMGAQNVFTLENRPAAGELS